MMNDTQLLDGLCSHEWIIRRRVSLWVVMDGACNVIGEGASPRRAIEDAILRLTADMHADAMQGEL